MTCSLNTFGKITDLDKIIECIEQKYYQENEKYPKKGKILLILRTWFIFFKDLSDNEFDQKNRIQESRTFLDSKPRQNWFDKFFVNFSPCGNLVVLSSDKHLVICMGKWDMTDQVKFSISSKLNLSHLEE